MDGLGSESQTLPRRLMGLDPFRAWFELALSKAALFVAQASGLGPLCLELGRALALPQLELGLGPLLARVGS